MPDAARGPQGPLAGSECRQGFCRRVSSTNCPGPDVCLWLRQTRPLRRFDKKVMIRMKKYIAKRIAISVLLIFIISVFAFMLIHILPGDPARLALGFEASEEDVQAYRTQLNLDKPLLTQYTLWISGLIKGDFGTSILYSRPNLDILAERLPRTLGIGLPALFLSIPLGILIGVVCAVKRGKAVDQLLTLLTTIGIGTPVFWLAILGIYAFALGLKALPVSGYTPISQDLGDYLRHAILPVTCMSISMIASIARQTRTNMLDSLNQDFVRTVRANGLSERSAVYKHALRNALIPVVTTISMQVRVVIGGSLLVEQAFAISGLGSLLTNAINGRDYVMIQNTVLIISLFTVGSNLLVDLLYGVIDPRIRLGKG